MQLATLYFGPDRDGRCRRMVETWLAAIAEARLSAAVIVISDEAAPRIPHATQLRIERCEIPASAAAHPFDLKGALVCAALPHLGPFLCCDADALPVRDPAPWLAAKSFDSVRLAMPIDFGSARAPLLRCADPSAPFYNVLKRCAGVMFFGDARPHVRLALVTAYWTAFAELLSLHSRGVLQEKRSLLEQWAWSLVFHRLDSPHKIGLPDSFNWPAGVSGRRADTVIEHWYGEQKSWRAWGTGPDAAPGRLTELPDVIHTL